MTAALGKWNDHSQPSIHWPPKTKEGPPVPHQSFIHSYLCHPQKTHELGECLELKILSWLLDFFSSVYQSDPDLACSLLQTLTHRFLFDSTQLCELNIMDFMALWNLPDLCSCCCLKTWVVISFAFPDSSFQLNMSMAFEYFHHEFSPWINLFSRPPCLFPGLCRHVYSHWCMLLNILEWFCWLPSTQHFPLAGCQQSQD